MVLAKFAKTGCVMCFCVSNWGIASPLHDSASKRSRHELEERGKGCSCLESLGIEKVS